jgi:hypothetical protein
MISLFRLPSLEFSWKSYPPATSQADLAVIGEEANGQRQDEKPS